MIGSKPTSLEVWFVTGSQHLYGEEALAQVAANSRQVVEETNWSENLPIRLVFKPVVTTPDSITQLCLEAVLRPTVLGWFVGCIPSRPRRCGSPA